MPHLNDDRGLLRHKHARHPLGPLVRYKRSAAPGRLRLVASVVLLGFLAPLAVAALATPDPGGVGTPRQPGKPACAMLVVTGYPCPTCGMTTAFAHTVRGRWIRAFRSQPMGWMLAVAMMLGACAALCSLVTGGTWLINWYRIPPLGVVLVILLLFAGAWGYKSRLVLASSGGWRAEGA